MPTSAFTAARLNRLSYLDRATGEPIRAYEHPYPGSLVHVDVKKFGNIPDGGGWRYVGRLQGERNRSATPDKLKSKWGNPDFGHAFMHTIIDDHSRVAYTEVHDEETPSPPSGCCIERWRGSPNAALPPSEFCRTTEARTGPSSGATPARPWPSRRSAHVLTGLGDQPNSH